MSDWAADAKTLCEGLREQREIYADLETDTLRQGEVLLAGQTDEILALARSKESTLERIEAIEKRIAPLKARWIEERNLLQDPLRAEVEEELDRLHELLEALISLESEQQRQVENVRRETSDKLKKIEGGRRVNQAYSAPTPPAPTPRYVDRTE